MFPCLLTYQLCLSYFLMLECANEKINILAIIVAYAPSFSQTYYVFNTFFITDNEKIFSSVLAQSATFDQWINYVQLFFHIAISAKVLNEKEFKN